MSDFGDAAPSKGWYAEHLARAKDLCAWMRASGVVHADVGGVTLTLCPAPAAQTASVTTREQDVREAEEDDVRALFQSSPVDLSDEMIGWMRKAKSDG